VAKKGRMDILVNNASIHRAYKIIDFPLREWERVFSVNMTGVFICAKQAARIMINQRSGVMICISACSARKADDMHAAYSSSKAAQIEFNRVLALELGSYGIRTNCILPGATETDMLKDVFASVPGLRESIISKTTLGKLAVPRDQANAALFLASDLASHITGEYIIVSGGEFYNP
jgi:NAD(P)-dependent dehydrogenase (short-subunit alcohol dehydrogenase family)